MGGGAIRTAAKVAGVGVGSTALRCGLPPAEHAAMRHASRPIPATISAAGGITAEAPANNSWVLIDDWGLDTCDEPLLNQVYGGGDDQMLPRLVFGPPPTLEEAKAATNDLKDALEKAFSPSRNLMISNTPFCNSSRYSGATHDCISFDSEVIPKGATEAFAFLCNSAAAQDVVASIAADENVWHAVLENPALKNFIKSNKPRCKTEDEQSNYKPFKSHMTEDKQFNKPCYKTEDEQSNIPHYYTTEDEQSNKPHYYKTEDEQSNKTSFKNYMSEAEQSDNESLNQPSAESCGSKSNGNKFNFKEMLDKLKMSVSGAVNDMSVFIHSIFGPKPEDVTKEPQETNDDSSSSFTDKMLASFFALATMVIMMVVMKRS